MYRKTFSEDDDLNLMRYIAVQNPQHRGRAGNTIYLTLEDNVQGKWPWASRHPWQSWRERYRKNQDLFDRQVKDYQRKHGISALDSPPAQRAPFAKSKSDEDENDSEAESPATRVNFTSRDDTYLKKYLARYYPTKTGRQGNNPYQTLVLDPNKKWPWAKRHTWQSWRNRYKKHRPEFDGKIELYQRKKGVFVDEAPPIAHLACSSESDPSEQSENEVDELPDESNGVARVAAQKRKRTSEPAERASKKPRSARRELSVERMKTNGAIADASVAQILEEQVRGAANYAENKEDNDPPDKESGTSGRRTESRGNVPSRSILPSSSNAVTEEDRGSPDPAENPTAGTEMPSRRIDDHDVPQTPEPDGDMQNSPIKDSPALLFPDSPGSISVIARIDENPPYPAKAHESESEQPRSPALAVADAPRSRSSLLRTLDRDSGVDVCSPRSIETDVARQNKVDEFASGVHGHTVNKGIGIPSSQMIRTDTAALSSIPTPPRMRGTQRVSTLRQKRPTADDDFFQSSGLTSPDGSRSSVPRQPPRVVEGPFKSSFTDARGRVRSGTGAATSSGGSEDEIDVQATSTVAGSSKRKESNLMWPPPRRKEREQAPKVDRKGKGRADPPVELPRAPPPRSGRHSPSDIPNIHVQDMPPPPSLLNGVSEHHPFSQPTQQITEMLAQHSRKSVPEPQPEPGPSRLLSSSHHPFSQPTQAPPVYGSKSIRGRDVNMSTTRRTVPVPMESQADERGITPTRMFIQERFNRLATRKLVRETSPQLDAPTSSVQKSNQSSKQSTNAREQQTSMPAPSVPRRSDGADSTPFEFPPRLPRSAPSPDPFLENPQLTDNPRPEKTAHNNVTASDRDKDRRKTFGGFVAPAAVHSDHYSRSRDTDSLLPIRREATSPRRDKRFRPSSRRQSGMNDQKASSSASFLAAEDRSLAMHVGVDELVRRMSENHGFAEDIVKNVLNAVKSFQTADAILLEMRETANETAAKLIHAVHDDDDEDPGEERSILSGQQLLAYAGSPRKGHTSTGLQYRPAPVEEEPAIEYSPPDASRAGQFARLLKQGRKAEAIRREIRRASHGSASPHKLSNLK